MDVQSQLNLIKEGSYVPSPQHVLNEAYYGKNPALVECERLMEDAVYGNGGINSVRKVTKILKELFNFSDLSIVPFGAKGAAATLPITTYKFKHIANRIIMEKSKPGLQFKSSDKVQAVILISLTDFRLSKMTGEEMLAIILHEIGHSMRMILPSTQLLNAVGAVGFTAAIWPAIMFNFLGKQAVAVGDFVGVARDIVNTFMGEAAIKVQTFIKGATYLSTGFENIKKAIFILKHVPIKNFKNAFVHSAKTTIGIAKVLSPFNLAVGISSAIFSAGKFKEELLADFIATSYGYGPSLTSALGKLTITTEVLSSNPVIRLISLPANIINMVLDPHPANISRMKQVIQSLETELEKGINANEFKLIKEDIETAKTELDKYEAQVKKFAITQFDRIVFRKVMGKLIKGNDDVKTLFFNLTPKDLEMMDGLEALPQKTTDPQTMQECIQLLDEATHIPRKKRNDLIDLICEN